MTEPSVFAVLRAARRVWAIAAVHGEAERLGRLHEALAARIEPGDRIVYTGNLLGRGPAIRATVDAMLEFRRAFLALPGMFVHDFVCLRGAQEEIWQRLSQLQFAVNPGEVFGWMMAQGVGATMEAYGLSPKEGESFVRQGPLAITRWAMKLRAAFQAVPGHQEYMSSLKRAAFTRDNGLLFVHRGFDPERPLEAQGDVFWWGTRAFDQIEGTAGPFRRVVRGFDPKNRGIQSGPLTSSLDAGCGFGGPLVAGCFAADGRLVDSVEA